MVLATTLALALLSQAGDAAPPAAPREPRQLVAWWQQDVVCAKAGLGSELCASLGAELDNLQTSYQVEQTKLIAARERQSRLLADPATPREVLTALNRDEVQPASSKMQMLNFEARMLVRSRLQPSHLEALVAAFPHFFAARWFQASSVPVREGVLIEGE